VSAIIRNREGGAAFGGIILTASHNPGGIDEDFGIKYNVSNGGPAPEALTDAMFARTKALSKFRWCPAFPEVDLSTLGAHAVPVGAAGARMVVEVIDPVEDYAALLGKVFDMPALRAFVARPDFTIGYDGLSGGASAPLHLRSPVPCIILRPRSPPPPAPSPHAACAVVQSLASTRLASWAEIWACRQSCCRTACRCLTLVATTRTRT